MHVFLLAALINISGGVAMSEAKAEIISAGRNHTCFVAKGGVQCWGGEREIRLNPVQIIPENSGVTQISIGFSIEFGHTCIVVNGGVKCWGENTQGQLGDGTTTYRLTPVEVIPANSGATAIATGEKHTCAVIGEGVKCWGNNFTGQLGDGTKTNSYTPVEAIPENSGVTSISAGTSHTCAVVKGGVKCWGAKYHRLNNGEKTNNYTPIEAISENSGATSISVGISYTCAVVNSGVKCWANDCYGDLQYQITTIPKNSGVTSISAGTSHTCAVENGGVKCWKGDDHRQWCKREAIPINSGATAIATGEKHTCAVIGEGVKCWGNNFTGQLGDGSSNERNGAVNTNIIGSHHSIYAAMHALRYDLRTAQANYEKADKNHTDNQAQADQALATAMVIQNDENAEQSRIALALSILENVNSALGRSSDSLSKTYEKMIAAQASYDQFCQENPEILYYQ